MNTPALPETATTRRVATTRPPVVSDSDENPVEDLRALRAAIGFAFVAADQEIYGADEQPHAFEVTFDGDGYNEPYSVSARCVCRGWAHDWSQPDPAQTGRPEVADLLVAWVGHYDLLTPATPDNDR